MSVPAALTRLGMVQWGLSALVLFAAPRDSVSLWLRNEDDLDMVPSEVRLVPRPDGKRGDSSSRGLG